MRLVRLKLRPSIPFWILKPITLRQDNNTSPLIDVDKLTEMAKKAINRSIAHYEIFAYDTVGNLLSDIDDVNMYESANVDTTDIEDEEELFPEIVSVTVSDEEIVEIDNTSSVSDQAREEARILLAKNGNTIKKLVSIMEDTVLNRCILAACLELEPMGKNRQGLRKFIEDKLS